MTFKEFVTTAQKCTTKEEAHALLAVYLRDPHVASIALENLAYYTGYMASDVADRVMKLFQVEHPIFGKKHPTPEEALRAGIELGQKLQRRSREDSRESALTEVKERFLKGYFKYTPVPKDDAAYEAMVASWKDLPPL